MGRRYTQEDYLELVKKIKNKISNVALTTDIIVGFPNESEEDFLETLKVVEEVKYDGAFTFIYSPRKSTPAARIEDSVSHEEKEKRLQKLNSIVNNYSLINNKKLENTIVKVLVLGTSEKDDSKVYGYTEGMKLVNITGSEDIIGEIVDVKIVEAKSFSLEGTLL